MKSFTSSYVVCLSFMFTVSTGKCVYCNRSNITNINEANPSISSWHIKSSLSLYRMTVEIHKVLHIGIRAQECEWYFRLLYNFLCLSVQTHRSRSNSRFSICSHHGMFNNVFDSSFLCLSHQIRCELYRTRLRGSK